MDQAIEDCVREDRLGEDLAPLVDKQLAGEWDCVGSDLSKYFDTIPHVDLLKSVPRRISDRHVLWLIKLWLKAAFCVLGCVARVF
jgi:RNA-directed DNA polymerase